MKTREIEQAKRTKDKIEGLRKRNQDLELKIKKSNSTLAEYVDHQKSCRIRTWPFSWLKNMKCTCGFYSLVLPKK